MLEMRTEKAKMRRLHLMKKTCVDVAMILSNCKIVAQDTPSNLVKDINAKNAYFGNSFKFN